MRVRNLRVDGLWTENKPLRSRGNQGPLLAPERATVHKHAFAEPRPNAYIPDDIGIPKPYGALAPFKPTECGATMRHIRRPQPREIEL